MHDNKGKKFYRTKKISFKWLLFLQYYQELYLEPNQSLWWSFFAKIVNDF